MFYKRENDLERKGPGKILEQNRPEVFIRQSSCYIKALIYRVHHANTNLNSSDTFNKSDVLSQITEATAQSNIQSTNLAPSKLLKRTK